MAKNGDDADGESYVDLPRGDDRGGVWILDKSTDLGDQFICGEDGVKCEVLNCLLECGCQSRGNGGIWGGGVFGCGGRV